MRRILEKLWASAQARVASLPNAPRLLATTRASLGMVAAEGLAGTGGGEQHGDDDSEEVEVAGIGPRQGSRGMREELKKARSAPVSVGVGVGVGGGGGGVKGGKKKGRDSHLSEQEQQEQARFLKTYVFLEEFLKELFCALSAKSHVESDKQGLTESHRLGSQELVRGVSVEDGEASPLPARFGAGGGGGRRLSAERWGQREDGGGAVEHEELPTSLDEFLREAAFPTLVSRPVL